MNAHKKISYFKSAFRIVGFWALSNVNSFNLGLVILAGAEILGIVEEFGE
jgi:hypothetical protein